MADTLHNTVLNFLKGRGCHNFHKDTQKGKHPKLTFTDSRGDPHSILWTHDSPADPRAVKNTVARLKKQIPPALVAAKPPTNLEALSMAAEQDAHRKNGSAAAANGHDNGTTKAMARRVVASIGSLPPEPTLAATTSTPEPARAAPEPVRPLNSVFASSIAIHGDDVSADYDLIFRSRRKQVTGEGVISVFNRPVACITIPGRTILELFDALEPVVEILRPPPAPLDERVLNLTLGLTADGRIEPPKAEAKQKQKQPSRIRGLEAIMQVALLLQEGKRLGLKTKHMHDWLDERGLDYLSSRARFDLRQIAKNSEAIMKWAEGQPRFVLDKLVPASLLRILQALPPPPKEEPKTILETQQQKATVVKRSHKKKPPIEPPKILEASEAPVETPILESSEAPKILEDSGSSEQILD